MRNDYDPILRQADKPAWQISPVHVGLRQDLMWRQSRLLPPRDATMLADMSDCTHIDAGACTHLRTNILHTHTWAVKARAGQKVVAY